MKLSPLLLTTRMIRLQEVLVICGRSDSTIYTYTKRGEFPARVKITRHASACVREKLLAWVESRIHASHGHLPATQKDGSTLWLRPMNNSSTTSSLILFWQIPFHHTSYVWRSRINCVKENNLIFINKLNIWCDISNSFRRKTITHQ